MSPVDVVDVRATSSVAEPFEAWLICARASRGTAVIRRSFSGLSNSSACRSSSMAGCCSRGARSARLVCIVAKGSFPAMRSARAWAAASSPSDGCSDDTIPHLSASSASRMRPVRRSSLARASPTISRRRQVAPAAAMMPSPVSGLPILRVGVPIRRSAAYASSAPPPSAYPSIAAITGIGSSLMRMNAVALIPLRASDARRSRSCAMSAPDAKTPPEPVRISVRGSASSSAHRTCRASIVA